MTTRFMSVTSNSETMDYRLGDSNGEMAHEPTARPSLRQRQAARSGTISAVALRHHVEIDLSMVLDLRTLPLKGQELN
jgi:hypothetical protein